MKSNDKKKNRKKKVEKKEMSNKKKIIIFTVIIILVISLVGFISYKVLVEPKKNNGGEVVKKNQKEIEGYKIYLDDSDSELYREEFYKLKDNLTGKEINYDEYAESIAKMFIIDLYSIKTKINKYDIGGVDFVYPKSRDNFKDNVTDTIYKYVEDNSNGKRTQELPLVKEINIEEVKQDKFKITEEEKEYPSYKFNITWVYEEDLGYDSKGEVIVINKKNKMYVVEKN